MINTKRIQPRQELIINGLTFKEKILEVDINNGVWTFKLDNGSMVMATGSVLFTDDVGFFCQAKRGGAKE